MAIRTWHPGKLALIWLVCLVIAIPLFAWTFESHLIIVPPENSPEYRPFIENLRTDRQYKIVALGAAILLSATPVVLTWLWLSGREKRPTSHGAAPNA